MARQADVRMAVWVQPEVVLYERLERSLRKYADITASFLKKTQQFFDRA